MNAPFDLAAVRKWRDTAVINGYRPIRVRSRGKEPVAPHWQHGEADASLLEVTADAANTGMICRGFRVIDVDIDDPGLVWEITKILNAHLPAGAIVRRRDGSPRYAMVFRAKGEPGKRSVSTARGKVEVLGAGQQLVIDGLHPSGARLTWTGGRSPATVAADDLPVVSDAQIESFLSECAVILGADRVTSGSNFLPHHAQGGLASHALESELAAGIDRGNWFDGLTAEEKRGAIKASLDAINNRGNDPRDQWLSVVFAVADAETRGCPDARQLALEWSMRGIGWTSEGDFDRAWNSFKLGATTVGSLIYLARQAGADFTLWQKTVSSDNQLVAPPQTTILQAEAPSFADPYSQFVGPKFPASILPPVLADFVAAEHVAMGADLSALAMAALAGVGAALTSETRVQVGDAWYERPIFFVAIIGDPSTMKSPVIAKVTKALSKIDHNRDAAWRVQKSLWDQQKRAGNNLAPYPAKPARCIIQDATPEKIAEILARGPAGALMVQDELAGWMASFDRYGSGASSRAFYLTAFNGGPYLKDRVGQGVRDENAEIRVENLALCILGGIQPDRLAELRDLTSDGLLQRFLVVLMAPAKRGNQKHPVAAEEALYERLIQSVHSAPPGNYHFAPDAEPVLNRVLDQLYELEQVQGFSAALIGAIGKFKGYFARFALTLEVAAKHSATIQSQPAALGDIVSKQTAEAAEQLLFKFLLPHTFGLYDVVANGGQDRDTIRAIGDFILASDKDRLRPSDFTAGVRRLRSQPANKIAEWASRFCALGWIRPEDERATVPRAWSVDPGLRTYFAARRLHAQAARAAAHDILKAGGTRR